MTNLLADPIFAAAGEAVIYLLVVVFTLISWIVNLANSQKQKNEQTRERSRPQQQRGQQRTPRRERTDERIQNEIEVFLQDVRSKRDTRRQPPEPELVAELVPEEEPHHESLRSQLEEKRRLAARETEKATRKKARLRPKVGATELPHLESNLAKAEEVIALGPDGKVVPLTEAQRSAKRAEESARELQAVYGAQAIGNAWTEIFRDPEQVRRAIVLNEILAKPKSLR